MNLPHPNKTIITREQMAALEPAVWQLQRKFDGELSTHTIKSNGTSIVILGELMKQKSGGMFTWFDITMFNRFKTWFAAFTIIEIAGQNVLHLPTSERWRVLKNSLEDFEPGMLLAGSGHHPAGMVATCVADGAEGVVAHKWDSPWGNMLCCKQGWLGVCRVFGLVPGSQSVFIVDAGTGQARGKLKVGLKNVRVGSLIRVEALSVHESGALREAKLCTNWLVEY